MHLYRLPDFSTLLGDAFNTKGGKTKDQAKEFNIYYDFKPALVKLLKKSY